MDGPDSWRMPVIESTYHQSSSFLHTFDPRAKLIILVSFAAVLFIPMPIEIIASYTGVLLILSVIAAGIKQTLLLIRTMLPLIILVILLTPPFYHGGEILVIYEKWVLLTTDGLERTLRLLLRFTGITFAFYAFFKATKLNEVILTLRWFGMPLQAALIVSMSFRFVPFVSATYSQVTAAHRLRGSIESGMWGWSKLKALMPVLTSVLVKSVKAIPVISMSLEHRGFGNGIRRTSYQRLKGGRSLFTHLTISVMISLIIYCVPFLLRQ